MGTVYAKTGKDLAPRQEIKFVVDTHDGFVRIVSKDGRTNTFIEKSQIGKITAPVKEIAAK